MKKSRDNVKQLALPTEAPEKDKPLRVIKGLNIQLETNNFFCQKSDNLNIEHCLLNIEHFFYITENVQCSIFNVQYSYPLKKR